MDELDKKIEDKFKIWEKKIKEVKNGEVKNGVQFEHYLT